MQKNEWTPFFIERWHVLNSARMLAACPKCDETLLTGSAECQYCDEKLEITPHGTTIYE